MFSLSVDIMRHNLRTNPKIVLRTCGGFRTDLRTLRFFLLQLAPLRGFDSELANKILLKFNLILSSFVI